jgi:hypothetical protein
MRMRVGCGRIQPRSGIRCWPALSMSAPWK